METDVSSIQKPWIALATLHKLAGQVGSATQSAQKQLRKIAPACIFAALFENADLLLLQIKQLIACIEGNAPTQQVPNAVETPANAVQSDETPLERLSSDGSDLDTSMFGKLRESEMNEYIASLVTDRLEKCIRPVLTSEICEALGLPFEEPSMVQRRRRNVGAHGRSASAGTVVSELSPLELSSVQRGVRRSQASTERTEARDALHDQGVVAKIATLEAKYERLESLVQLASYHGSLPDLCDAQSDNFNARFSKALLWASAAEENSHAQRTFASNNGVSTTGENAPGKWLLSSSTQTGGILNVDAKPFVPSSPSNELALERIFGYLQIPGGVPHDLTEQPDGASKFFIGSDDGHSDATSGDAGIMVDSVACQTDDGAYKLETRCVAVQTDGHCSVKAATTSAPAPRWAELDVDELPEPNVHKHLESNGINK